MTNRDWIVIGGIGIAAWLIFSRSAQAYVPPPGGSNGSDGGQTGTGPIHCKYPDGTIVPVLPDGTCPYNAVHGGQSGACYPGNEPGIESVCFFW
jgi:hypothetical protein